MNADSHALAGAYVLDALTDVEREQFGLHLQRCPDCQSDVDSFREPVAQLAAAAATEPPVALRASVLDAISGVRPLPPVVEDTSPHGSAHAWEPEEPREDAPAEVTDIATKRRPRVQQLLAAVAAAVVAIGVVVWSPWSQPDGSSPQQTVAEQVMAADDAQTFTTDVDGAQVIVVRSASMGKAVLQTKDMDAAPSGKDYQAWYLVGDEMVSAGVMPKPSDGASEMALEGDAMDATAVAISVEPEGGSESPTQPIAKISLTD